MSAGENTDTRRLADGSAQPGLAKPAGELDDDERFGLIERQQLQQQSATGAATIWPSTFAIGVAVLLVGLIVNPEMVATLGAAIALVAGFGWTAGPAARALDRYQFSIRNSHLWLGDLDSVSRVQGSGANARIHAFALRDAGQPVTKPESLLYPIKPAS
jgi:hypothetical protein